jgi:hypothetical protein
VLGLNSLNGEGLQGPERASEFQGRVLDGLMKDCMRVSGWSFEGSPRPGKNFSGSKGWTIKEMKFSPLR